MTEATTDPSVRASRSTTARVLIVAGYFDWFSGYQETALAHALQPLADVEVVASDRVSPAFTDEHLDQLGVPRKYPIGQTAEHGVTMTRVAVRELRSMVWSLGVVRHVSATPADLIIQVMPGQVLSAAPSLSSNRAPKLVLYGDNRAMWSHLPGAQRLLKGAIFAITKGLLYTLVNSRATTLFAYTPDTQSRLRPFLAGKRIELMPLCYVSSDFHHDQVLRERTRNELGILNEDIVILAAGKTDPRKHLEWLIRSVALLGKDHHNLRLILVGDDKSAHSRELHQEAVRLKLADRVYFLPFANSERLNGLFNAADLGVWPRNPAITIQQSLGTGLSVILPENDLVGHLVCPKTGSYFELKDGSEVKFLASAMTTAIVTTDFGTLARQKRARQNEWLSADAAARRLLNLPGLSKDQL